MYRAMNGMIFQNTFILEELFSNLKALCKRAATTGSAPLLHILQLRKQLTAIYVFKDWDEKQYCSYWLFITAEPFA